MTCVVCGVRWIKDGSNRVCACEFEEVDLID